MKENQRVALSKRLLKEALVRLLEKKKLDNITVFELCAEAGINRATFYRHYGIPKDLLLDLELDMVEEIRSVLKKPFQKENVLENIETIFTYLYERSRIVKIMLLSNSDADLIQLLNAVYSDMWKEYAAASDAQDLDEETLRLLSVYFGGGGYFLLRYWLLEDIPKTPQEIVKLIVNVLELSNKK